VGLRSASDLFYFELDEKVSPDTLLSIVDSINIFQAAVLVRAQSPQGEVFLQAAMPAFYLPPETGVKEEVFRAIPVMMFLRYAGGEHCWSSPTHFANLTVDDPWLAEPYGYLSYFGLLAEMEKSNFHTTIAFIPWNFDRSTSAVGELFRRHPDRFSIAVHGNNHDHREFYKYQTSQVDYAASKSLAKQEASLRQGLARMEQFTTLTGIPYDRIMIFPQGIAPQKTLNLLKKYDFLATINGTNVPIDAATPTDPIFYLRTFTMGFENFPSAVRYWPTRSSFAIALDLFCGNPLFFYTHHHFFESGIAAFNRTAELVNKLEPGIAWRNLRTIVQSWYLERLRDDGHIDVVTFSHDFVLANRRPGNATFFVQKEETFDLPINRVTVNDQTVSYERAGDTLTFALSLPAGASRQIIIEYANDFDPAQINVSKGDLRVALLRRLSDFRDRTLSQNLAGRTLTRYYYELGLFRFGLLWLVSFLVVSGFLGLYFYRRLRKPGAIR
ncbi:MAG TPA: hypothetical protein VGA99_11570, partial [bacterium]